MADWAVGGVTFADPAGMADADGLVEGRYWIGDVQAHEPRYERRLYAFPGVDGQGVKAFGFRGRTVSGEVAYVADGLAALRSAINSDRAALANSVFASTPPGGDELEACELSLFPDGKIMPAAGGMLVLRTRIVLKQIR